MSRPKSVLSPSPASGAPTSSPTLEQAWKQGTEAQVGEREWGVKKILNKKKTRSGTEYKVRWKDTWLGNARKLLCKFEAQGRAQHGHKQGIPAHICKI